MSSEPPPSATKAAYSAPSNGHDDLAELLIRFEIAMRLYDLFERKGLCDDRFQRSRCKSAENETFGGLAPLRIGDDLAIEKATQRQTFSEYIEQRKRRLLLAQCAIFEEDPSGRHGRRERLERRSADRIEDHPHALIARDF